MEGEAIALEEKLAVIWSVINLLSRPTPFHRRRFSAAGALQAVCLGSTRFGNATSQILSGCSFAAPTSQRFWSSTARAI